jgi:hypothetical protein
MSIWTGWDPRNYSFSDQLNELNDPEWQGPPTPFQHQVKQVMPEQPGFLDALARRPSSGNAGGWKDWAKAGMQAPQLNVSSQLASLMGMIPTQYGQQQRAQAPMPWFAPSLMQRPQQNAWVKPEPKKELELGPSRAGSILRRYL